MFDLPDILGSKAFDGQNKSKEHEILMKVFEGKQIEMSETYYLLDAFNFYSHCLPKLLQIDLTKITDEGAIFLKNYLGKAFTLIPYMTNDLSFGVLSRVSTIIPKFLTNDKVRNPKFLSYPDKDSLKQFGKYNRANSSDYPVFYASAFENVAVMETKPTVNSRIIISTWFNFRQHKFISYPIPATDIMPSEIAMRAAYALDENLKNQKEPISKDILSYIFAIISQEFTKKITQSHPNRYEYLISAFFGDKILQEFNELANLDIDCIVYPSVAWNHQHENLAIVPSAVDTHLRLVKADEYLVEKTFYDETIPRTAMPAILTKIRQSKFITEDEILWDDD